jgi:protein-histidine N-methyltransferase
VTIYKRNLEDVKFQIIQEDDEFDEDKKQEKKKEEGTITGPGGVEMLALAGKSDLVKGVYEGGLKTWECALDLVAYLADQKHNYDGQKVLEVKKTRSHFLFFYTNLVQVEIDKLDD